MAPTEHKPRALRHGVFLVATIERFGRVETTRHRVRDLSANGACVDRADVFRAGAAIVITVGNIIAVGASVRWVHNGLAGLQFSEPIVLAHALVKVAKPPDISLAPARLRLRV